MFNDNAFAQMNRLRTELEKVFGSDLKNYGCSQFHPKVNVWEDAESFLVEAEMPGINLEDIEILIVDGDQLSVKGERRNKEIKPTAWIRNERSLGKFARSFKLSCSVDIESVKASMKDGVLEIRLPKAATYQPRKIVIEVGE